MLNVLNPATGETIAEVPVASPEDVDRAVAAAREAFDHGPWPQMSPAERASITSNTYYDWLLDHAFMMVPAQAYVGRFLGTFGDFPPRQKAASFSIDQALEKLRQPSGD